MIQSKFLKDGEWKIESNSDVTAALNALDDPAVGPATVVFAPQTSLSHDASLDDLVYVLKRKPCTVRIMSPRFQSPSKPNEKMDSLCKIVFKEFNMNNLKCRLVEVRGHLSSEEVNSLAGSSLKSLGLAVAAADDVQTIANLISTLRRYNITTIHLSVDRLLKPEDFKLLQGLCPATLNLHFFGLTEKDVKWMTDVTYALDKPFTRNHVCVDAIYLSQSQLTINGVQEILRCVRQLHQNLQYPLYVEAPAVHKVAKRTLSEEANSGKGPRLYFETSAPHVSTGGSPLPENDNSIPPKLKLMKEMHEFKEPPPPLNERQQEGITEEGAVVLFIFALLGMVVALIIYYKSKLNHS